jgi:Na+/phosphate symporter
MKATIEQIHRLGFKTKEEQEEEIRNLRNAVKVYDTAIELKKSYIGFLNLTPERITELEHKLVVDFKENLENLQEFNLERLEKSHSQAKSFLLQAERDYYKEFKEIVEEI